MPNKAIARESRRISILLQLQAAYPAGLTMEGILQGLLIFGKKTKKAKIAAELAYLEEKGFIAKAPSRISAGFFRYRLSAGGLEYLESEGF
ncbi:MAG: hypothetical protein J6P03_07555 [Opitutales bacterium]|nr:hypothetical protein [Opitutales bacterium]